MAEINHRVGIAGSRAAIYTALTTDSGLSRWWTHDTRGAGAVGAIIRFRFNGGGPDFEVIELQPDTRVRWRYAGNEPDAWEGTEVLFELQDEQDQVFVRFSHYNWPAVTDFLAPCSTKWAVFLLSLKQLIETGQGRPFPDDIYIDHSEYRA
ncbi:MAG: SRPBCC domain-containing protein [Thiohalobacterales bacterium]|nr:SRPBCC domain-containing protein [Thiohalobacterales bacterium]